MIFRVASSGAVELIKRFEGLRLAAYQDAVGVWTIGYGHTGVVLSTITEQQADSLLADDLRSASECVWRKVGPPLTQNQFDALVSFVFNLGCGAFAGSTLLRLLNAGETSAAAQEFVKWDHAGAQVLPGLLARREAERDLFLKES